MIFLISCLCILSAIALVALLVLFKDDGEIKRRSILISLMIFVLSASSLALVRQVKPGEVGVIVNMFGSDQGVEDNELRVGYHWVLPWESLYKFPIFEQNHQWEGDSGFNFQTSEGMSIHADIGINYNVEPDKVHILFCKYRKGMEEITDLFIRNNIRDSINRVSSRLKVEELIGPRKEEFFELVYNDVRNQLDPLGFHVSRIFLIGSFMVPDTVRNALNLKIEASQRAQQRENELRESEAEAKKKIAIAEGDAKSQLIRAKAEADSNDMVSKSLTQQLLNWHAINKWNGIMPQTVAGEVPFIVQSK